MKRELEEAEREHEGLQRRIERLERQNTRLRRQLDAARRAGYRQAAPFAKALTPRPKRPGRRAGAQYGQPARRCRPTRVDVRHDVPLPPSCPACGGRVRSTGRGLPAPGRTAGPAGRRPRTKPGGRSAATCSGSGLPSRRRRPSTRFSPDEASRRLPTCWGRTSTACSSATAGRRIGGFTQATHQTCLAHLLRRGRTLWSDHPRSRVAADIHALLKHSLRLRDDARVGRLSPDGLGEAVEAWPPDSPDD